MCLTCGVRGATELDELCRECAQAGSEWTGLWEATLWLGEQPATTPDEARAVLAAVGWPTCVFEEQHPPTGTWLLELPPLHTRLLLVMGHLCHSGGGARVEVETP